MNNKTIASAEVIKKAPLDIPAIEVKMLNGVIYILAKADNTLYVLNAQLETKEKIQLALPQGKFVSTCDFIYINAYPFLFVAGSDAEKAFLVKLPTKYNRKHLVFPVDMSTLSSLLFSYEDVPLENQFNISSLAFADRNVFFVPESSDKMMLFDRDEFVEYVQGHTDGTPFPAMKETALNDASFVLRATDFFEGSLFYSSFKEENGFQNKLGLINLKYSVYNEYVPDLSYDSNILVTENGSPFTGRISSFDIYEKDNDKLFIALATAETSSGSEMLMLELKLG